MKAAFTESTVEFTALAWLECAGWTISHGPNITLDMPATERADYGEVVLARRTARHSAPQAHLWRTAKVYGAVFEG